MPSTKRGVRKAMILAAGLGTRLRPLTRDIPKPAVPMMGRPLIEYALRQLQRIGITEVVVNVHYQAAELEGSLDAAVREGLTVHRSHERQILGTAGGLKKVEALLRDDAPFLLWNADTLAELDFEALERRHRDSGAVATLLLRTKPKGTHYSGLSVETGGRIHRLGDPAGEVMFSGVWMLEPHVFDYLSGRAAGLQDELLPRLITEGAAFGSHQSGAFLTIDDPERYLEANLNMARSGLFQQDWQVYSKSPELLASHDVVCAPEARFLGRCVLGSRSHVSAGARLEDTILWDGAVVDDGARLRRCVVTRGVRVPSGVELSGKIIMPGARSDPSNPAPEVVDLVAAGAAHS